MSVDYAAGLSQCDDLGVCGLDEVVDKLHVVDKNIAALAKLLEKHRGSCVVHVGAGISTAAGIRDFRGKNGVWTEILQPKIEAVETDTKCDIDKLQPKGIMRPFDETEPTFSHMALKTLCREGYISHIVSQNVDGLFLKADLDRSLISELHGNFYLDECIRCRSRYIRATASPTMKLTKSVNRCPRGFETCKGSLRDTILDWDSPIPCNELRNAQRESKKAKLHICIGTTLQLCPSKELVCNPTRDSRKNLAIINLQPTKFDERAQIVIHHYADYVMRSLCNILDIQVEEYNRGMDPTKNADLIGTRWLKKDTNNKSNS